MASPMPMTGSTRSCTLITKRTESQDLENAVDAIVEGQEDQGDLSVQGTLHDDKGQSLPKLGAEGHKDYHCGDINEQYRGNKGDYRA